MLMTSNYILDYISVKEGNCYQSSCSINLPQAQMTELTR